MCSVFRALLQLGMDNIYSLLDTKQRAMLRTLSPLENETIDKLFKEVREKQNALCIPMQESLRKIISFKRNSKSIVVGYIADQTPLWWNIHHWVDFLHHDTPVLTGAERIIRHTNQVSFYGYMRRPNADIMNAK